jgi:hypothetical protein
MVKRKVRISSNFNRFRRRDFWWLLPAISVAIFVLSWSGIFPSAIIEAWYARRLFPVISGVFERIADSVFFSWLDLAIPASIFGATWLVRQRRLKTLLNLIAVLYLIFFWSWGLNYHRLPLSSKLPMDSARTKPDGIDSFTRHAAVEINRLYPEKQASPYNEAETVEEAVLRVRHVIQVIDGSEWEAPHQIKVSVLAEPWFHAAGIDGMFNPAGQEPIVSRTLIDVERPFVIAHELAHVRGYPDEGDANVIAALSTLLSRNPRFQYSGWLTLWLYLRDRQTDMLLDEGPRADLQRIFQRARSQQIRWVNGFQTAMLDLFLKANHVEQGVHSYSRVVVLTAGTEPYWDRFR